MINNLWFNIYDNYNYNELIFLTFYVLLISELPIIFFTLLDILQLSCLKKYRIKYKDYPNRVYPTIDELYEAGIEFSKILFLYLIPVTLIGLKFIDIIKWRPYTISRKLPTLGSFTLQYIFCSVCGDLLFYLFHRVVHHPKIYFIHRHHHVYKYNSFSLVNHVLHPIEVIMFIIPPALPPILIKSHISVMWTYAIITNWIGIYIHSGYQFSLLEKIIMVKSKDHDIHHVKPKKNFSTGLFYSLTDRVFGTYSNLE